MTERTRSPHIYKVGQYVNVTLRIVDQIRVAVKKGKYTIKGYIVQSVIYPNAKPYEINEYKLKEGIGCAYKAGHRICEDNSLWSVKSIRGNIINIEQAKTEFTKYSNKPTLFKCSTNGCENTKTMKVFKLTLDGYSCTTCSTNTSYPEKFFTAYLTNKNIKYEYQVRYDDLEGYIFDYKIVLNDVTFLVEVHGRQHYLKEDNGYYKVEKIQKSDSVKRQYAKENNINYIELDCRESDFNFIKKQINNNKHLPNIKKEDEKDIIELIEMSSKYNIQEIIRLYEVEKWNTTRIGKKYNTSYNTINRILKQNNIELRDGKLMVKCIETGIIYESLTKAGKSIKQRDGGHVSQCCRGERNYAGKHPITGEPLHWEFINL